MIYCRVLLVWTSSFILAAEDIYFEFTLIDFKNLLIAKAVSLACSMVSPAILLIIVYCMAGIVLKANTLKHENTRAMELRQKQNSGLLRMFAVITICFLILTIPYLIWLFYLSYMLFLSRSLSLINTFLPADILSAMFYANFSINPIIYAKMHREVNRCLLKLMQKFKRVCCHCCSKRKQEALLR